MGVITKIDLQKNKNRVNLFVDNSFFCGLYKEILLKNGLKVGQDIDESKLKEVITESETRRALDYAFNILGGKSYSEFELRKKLKSKMFETDIINIVISKLDEYHLIDDEAYAKILVESYKLDGPKRMENKLIQRGISQEIAKNAVNCLSEGVEECKIEQLSAKYLKNKEKSAQNLQKLYRYLIGRGFGHEVVSRFVSKIKVEEGSDESWD